MWKAKYKVIDKQGLKAELKISVVYFNDQDNVTYEQDYDVLPSDFNNFAGITQPQIDILNAKDAIQIDSKLIDTEI